MLLALSQQTNDVLDGKTNFFLKNARKTKPNNRQNKEYLDVDIQTTLCPACSRPSRIL